MADATYFEVRCERCNTSFAPGTKQCIHCGSPLGRRLLSLEPRRAGRPPASAPAELGSPQPDAPPDLGRIFRFVLIGLAIAAALARALLERG